MYNVHPSTIQPESRIKKVETQQKEKEKIVTNDKVQKSSLPGGRKHHAEAREETKVRVTDDLHVLQLCLLCFTLLKATFAIPHIYRFSRVSLSRATRGPQPSVPESTDQFLSFVALLRPNVQYFPPFPSCFSLIFIFPRVRLSLTFCIQRPSGASGLSVRPELLEPLLITNKTRRENLSVGLCWWCACTCMAAPPFASGPSLPPSPPPPSEKSVMSYIFSSILLSCAPSSPSVVPLPTV